ncbi:MAG: YIP1 family protein [bacterium]|nr:YIP1 family protein [candidate division KSB1 bacterium]MDH7558791.1 YIP1 family protein [bacterium]
MSRARDVLLAPRSAWEQIKAEQLTTSQIVGQYVALLAIVPAAAFYLRFFFSRGRVWVHFLSTAVYFVLCLALARGGARIIEAIARRFEVQGEGIDFLKLVAFSLTPAFLGGVFLVIPWLSGLTFLLALYSLYLLYVGIPMLVRCPDEQVLSFAVSGMVVLYVLFVVAYAVPRTMMALF